MRKFLFAFAMSIHFVIPALTAQEKSIQTIERIPTSIDEFNSYRVKASTTPEGGAAVFVTAMLMYSQNEILGMQAFTMILDKSKLVENSTSPIYDKLSPSPATYEEIKQYFGKHKDYLANAYIVGTSPSNAYMLPAAPYQVELNRNASSVQADGTVRLFISTTGADIPRPIVLKQNSRGLWKVVSYNALFVNVRLGDNINKM